MYKNKDGKVIASLTEVKNKTGDIFAIVDEFGEIALTSYNKVRYKIIKVDIENSVEINEAGPEVKIATTEKKRLTTPKLEERNETSVTQHTPKVNLPEIKEIEIEEVAEVEPEPVQEEPKLFKNIINIEVWDKDGKHEKDFSLNAVKPLIS